MPRDEFDDATVIRYLLDDVSEEAAEKLEEAYFLDTELFELVGEAEDRLIRNYLDGELRAADAERFERKYYRVPELRDKVAFTRNLRALAAERRAGRLRPIGWLNELFSDSAAVFRLSAGFAAVGLLALFFAVMTLHNAVETAGRPKPAVPAIAANSGHQTAPMAGATLVAVLKPGILKGPNDAPRWITVAANVREISLQFDLPGVVNPFQAHVDIYRLGDSRRTLVAGQTALAIPVDRAGASLTATFASAVLEAGDYLAFVKRDGDSNILESYEFGITRAASSIQ